MVNTDPARAPECQPQEAALPHTSDLALQRFQAAGVVAEQPGAHVTYSGTAQRPLGRKQRAPAQRRLAHPVDWPDQAKAELRAVVPDPAVRDVLMRTANEILHGILLEGHRRCVELGDAGAADGIMWHRGVPDEDERPDDEWLREEADGPQCYFLFYRPQAAGPGFEILSVRSVSQFAQGWELMSRDQLNRWVRHQKRRLPWGRWR